ncbi:flagellar hook assembly protein FlgD [Teredinibacter sp. KSP-S5-2]|uniref:flagellar hook assembly protein FlgD n=1 Tax=Teredinibacter sp. KSP-S5-2 TaxID=3034506 RepID=UPI002934B570|nr:flagellar hook capping FlgD N-terminal domain-containing protein [Teredinibacter sp. KSP-S5-2]WNO11334.1 flagellar hook capping FlgD N-terminal domain-containing protein [Teredinibacter sp. KSP-S5-2]
MPVDAIGGILSSASDNSTSTNSMSQEDFIKLFLTELNYQDPLEPVDNKEFLAQIAQFAAVDQNRKTTESIENLIYITSTQQSVSLLNKRVEVRTSDSVLFGTVTAIRFTQDGPRLTIAQTNGNIIPDIRLSQVSLIQNN